jgi:preprotein translocase subunit SecG
MAGLIIALLTVVLVLDCVALIFLVLIQLPKKEAGLGLAFGSGAADALFGAGSGTVLTKATKYAACIFFGLALLLGLLQSNYFRASSPFRKALATQTSGTGTIPLPGPGQAEAPAAAGGTVGPVTTPEAKPPIATPPSSAPATPAPVTPAPATPTTNPTPPK